MWQSDLMAFLSRGREFSRAIRSVGVIGALVVGVLPGMEFFTGFGPPYLRGALPLVGAVATGVVANAYFRRASAAQLKEAKRCLVLSLALAALYIPLRQATTVGLPEGRDGVQRWQVGFGTARCSLTPEALSLVERGYGSPQELMMAFGYGENTPGLIWTQWSIAAAGTFLSVVFIAMFVVWAHGIGVLARALSARQPEHVLRR